MIFLFLFLASAWILIETCPRWPSEEETVVEGSSTEAAIRRAASLVEARHMRVKAPVHTVGLLFMRYRIVLRPETPEEKENRIAAWGRVGEFRHRLNRLQEDGFLGENHRSISYHRRN